MSVWGIGGLTRGQAAAMASPGARSGQVYGPLVIGNGAGTTVAADTAYCHSLIVPETASYVGLQIAVHTAVAAVLGKMALYYAAPNGQIGSLVAACIGEADMNAAAMTNNQLNFASAQTLRAGVYWVACKFNGAAIPYGFGGGVYGGGLVFSYGAPSLSVYVRAPATSAYTTRATFASVYADAFSEAPTLTFGTGSPINPIMGIVRA